MHILLTTHVYIYYPVLYSLQYSTRIPTVQVYKYSQIKVKKLYNNKLKIWVFMYLDCVPVATGTSTTRSTGTPCACVHTVHHSKLYKSNFPDLVLSSMLHGSCVPSSSNSSRASLLNRVPPHPLLEGRRLDTGFTFVPVRFTCFLCFISL